MLLIVTDIVAWAVGLPVGVSVCHTSGKKGKGFPIPDTGPGADPGIVKLTSKYFHILKRFSSVKI